MRRWLPVGAPLVAGILALGAAGIMSLVGQNTAMAQQGDVSELAKRVIGGPGLGSSVSLLPGQRAQDLPLSLPMPGGSNVVGTVVRDFGQAKVWEVVLDEPGTPGDIGPFYDQALPGMGWAAAPAVGDQPAPQGVFCQSTNGPFVSIAAFQTSDRGSDVRARVVQGDPVPCGGQPPAPPPQP